MKNFKLFILFFVLASLLLNACGTSCDIETYQETVKPQIDKWQDAYQIANQTPRVSLASEPRLACRAPSPAPECVTCHGHFAAKSN